jgi:glucosylceramidase
LSKVLKPGSTRIKTAGYNPTNVTMVASENLDGTYGLVIRNNNDTGTSITVDDGTHSFDLTLPAKSLTSCLWKK